MDRSEKCQFPGHPALSTEQCLPPTCRTDTTETKAEDLPPAAPEHKTKSTGSQIWLHWCPLFCPQGIRSLPVYLENKGTEKASRDLLSCYSRCTGASKKGFIFTFIKVVHG